MREIGARDHEFADADGRGAGEDGGEVGGVGGGGVVVVEALVGGVGEVDADLLWRKRGGGVSTYGSYIKIYIYIYILGT